MGYVRETGEERGMPFSRQGRIAIPPVQRSRHSIGEVTPPEAGSVGIPLTCRGRSASLGAKSERAASNVEDCDPGAARSLAGPTASPRGRLAERRQCHAVASSNHRPARDTAPLRR